MSDADSRLLVRTALDGDAVLFVGAGFSRTAVNVRGDWLKTANELATLLCKELDLDEPAELSAAAEMFADERSPAALVTLLREQFQVRDIAEEHRAFGRVPWRRIYTTNYDDVVELAYRATGRAVVSVTPEDDARYVSSEVAQCVHINGYIGTLNEERLFADFKLTDSSYATTAFASSQWAQQMRHDFSVARIVMFVGYSLHDLDIRRLLRATGARQTRTFFYVGAMPSRVLSHRLSKFGLVVPLDAAALSDVICEEISGYTPAEPEPILGRVVTTRTVDSTTRAPQDRDIANLFLWGSANHSFVWGSVTATSEWRYVCYRDQLDQALQFLEDGVRNLVVRSDLGNGKSIFLDSLDCLATSYGFEVYRIDTLGEEFEGEVEAVARATKKTLLIIDSYNTKKAAVEIVARNRSDHLHLVCAARTIRHDVAFRWLHGILRTSEVPEIDLEVLSEKERAWFREALDEYGLWGRYASRSLATKERILRVHCGSRISSVLLLILESPTIAERLADVMKAVASKREHLETITGLLMLSVLDFHPSFDILTDLMGAEVLNQAEFQRSEAVRQLLDFRYERVNVRSNVVGVHLLKGTIDRSVSLRVLERLACRAGELSNKAFFRMLFAELMRAANVERVLPDSPGVVVSYYESVCKLPRARKNPNFWLQYAISNIAMKRYSQAKLKLETAYSLAGEGYDTFMLDTTHARWLLEEACEKPRFTREAAMAIFRKARNFLHPLLAAREERFNPFRVAGKYRRFFEQHRVCLNGTDRSEIAKAASFVLRRVEALPPERREQRYIRECAKELTRLLETCESGGA